MAPPVMTIDGDVVAVHSYWTADRSRIITKATVRTPDGTDTEVSQIGGTVDGIGMITWPAPELLVVGMKVAVAAHRATDLSLREHVVLDSAKVLAYPPGYVRTGPTKRGNYLYWEPDRVNVVLAQEGTTEVAGDLEFEVIDDSIASWNNAASSCDARVRLVNAGRREIEVSGDDRVNVIKFRDTNWGRPATGDDPARQYSPNAAGLTTAVYIDDDDSDRDGAILDADVELNGVDYGSGAGGFAISVDGMTSGTAACRSDLQNTLTHELGHLLGFEHTCLAGGDPPRRDHRNQSVPQCFVTQDPAIEDATMFPFQACDETKKSSLSDEDILGICEVYVKTEDGGCSAPSRAPSAAGLLLAGMAMLFTLRRRAR